jgi:8-hydroxy-5-deazaflavin:NADPH oxidoreductase
VKIGIIGSGRIGGTLGLHLADAGHEVTFSSRHPENLMDLVTRAGSRSTTGTPQEAAARADLLVFSPPWRTREEAAGAIKRYVANKIVIDTTNPYGENGQILDLEPSTSSEEIEKLLPGARVVKAFNTIYFEHLRARSRPGVDGPLTIFVAGDDPEAKQVVGDLIVQIGLAPVDTGSLSEGGRKQQPGSSIYNKPMAPGEAETALNND